MDLFFKPLAIFLLLATSATCSAASLNNKRNIELGMEDDEFTQRKAQREKTRGEALYLRNCRVNYGRPETPLERIAVLHAYLADRNRNYIGKICHFESWEFFLLADRLKPLINRPRLRKDGRD
jgi:hypothetical protein